MPIQIEGKAKLWHAWPHFTGSITPMHSSSIETTPHLDYRPDIQGLRAIAVFIVVACHAGLPGFSGGFIGVDIFFVLSGFLISGLLIREQSANGRIQFLRFYARRFKRLLPALLLMLIVTSMIAWQVLAPFEQIDQSNSARYVPFWISNLFFSFSNVDYFGQAASSNLFLHTWSLGVEEQFYLLWPVLLFFILGQKKNSQSSSLINSLSLLALISFLLSLYWSNTEQPFAFYLMPSRAWQFAIGGLCYIHCHRIQGGGTQPSSSTLRLLPVGGLLVIVLSTLLYHEAMAYPGIYALLPTLGTVALLISGSTPTQSQLLHRVLSHRIMQFVGNVSYSWYLWHWPVLLLGGIILANNSLPIQICLIALSFLLAVIAFFSVESPLRKTTVLNQKPISSLSIAASLMVVSFYTSTLWQENVRELSVEPEQVSYLSVRNTLPVIYAAGCDQWFNSSQVQACVFGPEDAENTAVMIGDSIGAQWFSAFAPPLIESGWRFVVFTKSSCPIVDESIFYERIGSIYTVCDIWRDQVIQQVSQMSPEIILIGSAGSYSFNPAQWNEGTQRILAALNQETQPVTPQHTSSIFILRPTFQLAQDGPSCLARKAWQSSVIANLSTCNSPAESELDATVYEALLLAANTYPNAHVLDLNSLNCPENICSPIQGEVFVYRDNQHLSDGFVSSVSAQVISMMQTMLTSP